MTTHPCPVCTAPRERFVPEVSPAWRCQGGHVFGVVDVGQERDWHGRIYGKKKDEQFAGRPDTACRRTLHKEGQV